MSDDVRDVLESVKRHPGRRLVLRQSVTALGSFGVAAMALVVSPLASVSFALIGALFVWSAWDLRRTMRGIVIAGRAHAAIASGDRELATKLLDILEGTNVGAQFRRIAANYRASLAMSAADPREAVIQSTRALGEPLGFLIRDATKSVAVLATSQRALARAMLHEDDAALADAEAANDDRIATPLAHAQAELARALVAANRDRKDDVRAILERAAPYMEDLNGRQRELAKRLARFAAPGKRTIYRHAAKSHEDEIATLIASPSETKSEIGAPPSVAAAPPPLTTKRPPDRRGFRVLMIWVLLMLLFVALWQVLNPPHPAPPEEPVTTLMPLFAGFAALVATLFYALVGLNLRRASKTRTARRAAVLKALAGDAAGIATLEGLAKRSPEAALELAQAYERRADFERALAACDQGITMATATRVSRMTTHDVALPGLLAERALCFAALGKVDEASAVLAMIPSPQTYPLAPLARFRIGLAQALARGDRKGALEIARKRGDTLGIPRRDAVLVDLLEATEGRGASDEEWSRLHAELAADAGLAKWIDHFLPSRTLERRVAEPLEEEEESAESAGEERVDA